MNKSGETVLSGRGSGDTEVEEGRMKFAVLKRRVSASNPVAKGVRSIRLSCR